MVFEIKYDEKIFLVELQYFEEKVDKMEIFALKYSDEPYDADEYEIKMYQIEGDELIPIRLTELPKEFLDSMGEELEKTMPKGFFANPYFDELFIFTGNTVLTSQDRYRPISCTQCNRKELYEKKDKDNKADYIKNIQAKLLKNPNPAWPYKGKLHIQFSVSDQLSRLNKIDVDNLAKTILDSLQGVVFENDAQISALVASKDYTNGFIAHLVAIKELEENESYQLQQYLFSERHKTYLQEYKKKKAVGKPTRFITY
jgi:Holliday junction resolvase RusA-like endonuclease